MVIGFVIGFSAVFNLGILARQRIQALPFLLAIIVTMGKGPIPDRTDDPVREFGLSERSSSPMPARHP
jgi:hypothetical protein